MAVGNPGKARLNIGQRFLQTPEAQWNRNHVGLMRDAGCV